MCMDNFECFCESVFYESTGLGSLYELDNALKVYIRDTRLTEALTRRTQPNFQADVNEVYEKARSVFHLTLHKHWQERFHPFRVEYELPIELY